MTGHMVGRGTVTTNEADEPGAPVVSGKRLVPYLLLLLALVVEGYDLQAANFAAPDLVVAMGVTRAEIGPLLSASLFGVLLGAVLIGPLGDRIGRRPVIIYACIGYGLLSLAAAAVDGLGALILIRFLIGVGLGGVLPNALALAGELAPRGRAATATALIGIGLTSGGVVAGLTAAQFLPSYGWRSLFVIGGILPLIISALLAIGLPESPAFLERQSLPDADRARASYGPGPLLTKGMAPITIGIWVIFAAVLMNVYLLSGWIPQLMADSGLTPTQGALVATAYHAGGVVGGVVASLILRGRGWPVVALFALAAAASLGVLASGVGTGMLLGACIIAAGFFVTGTQNAINGAAGISYPVDIRSAGLGWALGLGRVGSIAGPLVGSVAIILGMTEVSHFFSLPLIPLIAAGVIALWLRRATANSPES